MKLNLHNFLSSRNEEKIKLLIENNPLCEIKNIEIEDLYDKTTFLDYNERTNKFLLVIKNFDNDLNDLVIEL